MSSLELILKDIFLSGIYNLIFFSYILKIIIFNNSYQSTVSLQCCVSFSYVCVYIYTYTYIHSFLDSFPV